MASVTTQPADDSRNHADNLKKRVRDEQSDLSKKPKVEQDGESKSSILPNGDKPVTVDEKLEKIATATTTILEALGEDPQREGSHLVRVAMMLTRSFLLQVC